MHVQLLVCRGFLVCCEITPPSVSIVSSSIYKVQVECCLSVLELTVSYCVVYMYTMPAAAIKCLCDTISLNSVSCPLCNSATKLSKIPALICIIVLAASLLSFRCKLLFDYCQVKSPGVVKV